MEGYTLVHAGHRLRLGPIGGALRGTLEIRGDIVAPSSAHTKWEALDN